MMIQRFIRHGLVLGLLLTITVLQAYAEEDAEQFKAKLQQIAETSFAGDAAEYKAFSQNLGDSLVTAADAMLSLSDLAPDNKRFAILMKYWGLVRKYGFDEAVFDEKLADFVDSLQNIPEAESLYKSCMIDAFNKENFFLMETDEAIREFLPYREKFVPFIDKFYRETDERQLASKLTATADLIDQDGSAGLVASTVEMLMPTLKEQEKSKDFLTKSLAKSKSNAVRRVQMPGKEMKLEGVDLDGNVVDVKDFAGKVIIIQFYTTDYTDRLPILKKLDAALRDHGFVFLDYNVRDNSRDVARIKAEELELPWTILCRHAAYEKKLEDYSEYYGVRYSMFLVGRDGKVIGTWSRGLCPAVWQELEKLFPDQAEELAKLAMEDEQTQKETKEKYQKLWQAAGDEDQDAKPENETAGSLLKYLARMSSANRNLGDLEKSKERTQSFLELANLISAMPGLSTAQKNNALLKRIDFLETLGYAEVKEHPETNPAIIFEEMVNAVDEALADESIDETWNNSLVLNKIHVLRAMWEYMKRSDDKTPIAHDILNRYVDILNKETQHTNPYGGDNLVTIVKYGFVRDLEDMDEINSFRKAFFDAVVPILEKAKDPELQEYAKKLRGIERRIGSVGKEFDFECILMSGTQINVKDLRGKIVLVNFWATWCGPCIKEFPNMKTQYEKYKDKGYEMIALSIDANIDDIFEFQKKNDYPWLVGSDVKSMDAGLVDYHAYYGIQGVPTTFLLDRDGKVIFRMVGSDDERLNRELEKVFGE